MSTDRELQENLLKAFTLALLVTLLLWGVPCSAQIFDFPAVPTGMQLLWRTVDSAYDPIHDVYLVVGEDQSSARAVFIDAAGRPLGAPFRLPNVGYLCCTDPLLGFTPVYNNGSGSFRPRVTYGADLNDGAGGQGAFLVLWTESFCDPARCSVAMYRILGSIVAYPGRVVGSPWVQVSVGMVAVARTPALAYSSASHVFLVAHEQAGVLSLSLLNSNGQLMPKPPPTVAVAGFLPPQQSKFLVTWNSVTDEFGLFCADMVEPNRIFNLTLFRIGPDGTVRRRAIVATTDSDRFDVAINSETGNYLVAWSAPSAEVIDATIPRGVMGAEVGPAGDVLASGPISEVFGRNEDAELAFFSLSYGPVSGTFILAGAYDASSIGVVELNRHGSPNSPIFRVASGFASPTPPGPLAASSREAHWLMPMSDFGTDHQLRTQIIGTTTRGGGSDDVLVGSPCGDPNSDPYASQGGGQCVNGSWMATTQAPQLTTCTTPDPFVVLGGGTCSNGGWLPPGMGWPPPPTSVGCTTPDPFVAIGGGTCSNGGWLPPGMAPPGSTPPPTEPPPVGGCAMPDPFTVLGGGTCVNGGWLPPNFTPSEPPPIPAGCTTPDPFVTIGGGVCINGGWIPKGAGG